MSDVSTPAPDLDPVTGLPVDPTNAAGTAPLAGDATTAAPDPAPVPDVPAPAVAVDPTTAALLEAVQALTAQVAALQAAQPAAPAVVVPDNPPSPVNLFEVKDLVKFAWNDPYDGPSSQYGMVIEIFPDEGNGAQSAIAWLSGGVSGPIGDHTLTAV